MSDWTYPSPFILPLTVNASDIDVLGHANNTVYVNWCQLAAWAHSKALGIDVREYPVIDRAMVIHEAHYRYAIAALEGDTLEVGTWLTASDRRLTMTREFQIRHTADGAHLFSGRWDLVCVRVSDGKPMRMPPRFIEAYEPAVITR